MQKENFRRLLRTVEVLSDLGPELTAEREFPESAQLMLAALMEAAGAREAALFIFSDKPSLLTSVASRGFALLPEPAIVPLLPKHVHALTSARGPVVLNESTYEIFFSANGNVAPRSEEELFGLRVMLALAVATSIDALAVGITLPLLDAPFALSVVTIGVTTAVLCVAGLVLGRRAGAMFGRRLDALGGLILIGLGTKILLDHLRVG